MPSTRTEHEVVIVGAGIGGLGMAIELGRHGIDDFVILERAGDIGGTWRDNTYPGVAVDVPAQAYQFSYELNPEWRRAFAEGWEVKAYIDRIADKYDLRRHIRFGSEVTARTWDDDEHLWRLTVNGDREITTRFVVSAIGAFVDAKPVDIPGAASFAGDVLRSSSWDHSVELAGKRIAVIGTGASAVQIVPEVAKNAAQLHVFQRTPIWVGPKVDPTTSRWQRSLFRRMPAVQEVVRRMATRGTEFMLIDGVIHHTQARYATTAIARFLRDVWYRSQVRDRETRRKLTPDYEFGCKRPSVSDTYLRAFNRHNVELVTDRIAEITPAGIRTADGTERAVDVLVLATGFRLASDPENYRRTPVRGRDGFDLATQYTEHRLASYESVSMPGLPNHFMIFGPYGWVGGTWHQLVESAATHIVRVVGEARRRGATAVEVRPEACARWTEEMRDRLEDSLWHAGNCAGANSYYFDHHGDTPYLRPTSSKQAMHAARTVPFDDYRFERLDEPAMTNAPLTSQRSAS